MFIGATLPTLVSARRTKQNGGMSPTLPPLLSIFSEIWSQHILRDVLESGMTSERALQASLYFHLRRQLNGEARILVEPRMQVDGVSLVPDLFILTSDNDALFIELKLQNSAGQGIVWETDFQKFGRIESAARSGNSLQIPERGRTRPFPMPARRMYLFAAVGDETCRALQEEWIRKHAPRIVGIDARCFWAGGITDFGKERFDGPVEVVETSRPFRREGRAS